MSNMVNVQLASLKSSLCCPICTNVLVDAVTVVECNCSFCQKCLHNVIYDQTMLLMNDTTSPPLASSSTPATEGRLKHISDKKLQSKMNVTLPCPNCKDQNAKLNIYMESNGACMKDMTKRNIINAMFPSPQSMEYAKQQWALMETNRGRRTPMSAATIAEEGVKCMSSPGQTRARGVQTRGSVSASKKKKQRKN